jgi:hypothetical protein
MSRLEAGIAKRILAAISILLFAVWAIVGGWALLVAAVLVLVAEIWMAALDESRDGLSGGDARDAIPPDDRGLVP